MSIERTADRVCQPLGAGRGCGVQLSEDEG